MRAVVAWTDKVPERDGVRSVCYDIAFRPDGTQLIAAVDTRVLMYDAADGDLLHSLKGHKDTVYCVAYSRDGKRFASGGADKTVIIWTHKAEGILKYSHNDSIQCLAYNPVTQQLASATSSDFGLWSPEQKSVQKHKLPSKVLCCAWTNDGQHLALGLFNGSVTIREAKGGSEQVLIQRTAPIWSLAWNPAKEDTHDLLAVGCWDQTLSFYRLNGSQVGKDRNVECDPLSVSYFGAGEYLLLGGTDRKVSLCTKEGLRLCEVASKDDWVWCSRARPKQNYVAVACNDGSITMYQLVFSTVHGLYQDRYTYRDQMTDVIVQHLITEQKVRIKCKDYVKKIAVYKERLAVQLPDKVLIYELQGGAQGGEDSCDMQYQVAVRLNKRLDCNLLVVTSQHLILCLEKKLQLIGLDGNKEREWLLESVIRYIKVVGGPSGREGLLVGLKSGLILKILVDNPFPIVLVKHGFSIRCLDLSAGKGRLAVVDENAAVSVYDLRTKELVFEGQNANSVAWNSEMEHMLCYSGNGQLSIKTADFPVHQQKLQGFVVGFKGSKVFCLHYVSMQTIDVPQSASMFRFMEKGDFQSAYKIACLGVTPANWKSLALEALQHKALDVARKALIRIRDVRFLDLLDKIQRARQQQQQPEEQVYLAELLAYQGKYLEAARAFGACGHSDRALSLLSDLRMFEEAKSFASEFAKTGGGALGGQIAALIQKQAEWSEEVHDHSSAAEMYLAAGQTEKAVALLGRLGKTDKLLEVVRGANKTEKKALQLAAAFFKASGMSNQAAETYLKLGDVKSVLQLHVNANKWDEALQMVKQQSQLASEVYPAYARWLALQDRFEEAREALVNAGQRPQASRMLEQLASNAIILRRFSDASSLLHLLSLEALSEAGNSPAQRLSLSQRTALQRFWELRSRAEVYHAYGALQRASEQPFRSDSPEMLFQRARFLMMRMQMASQSLAAQNQWRDPAQVRVDCAG